MLNRLLEILILFPFPHLKLGFHHFFFVLLNEHGGCDTSMHVISFSFLIALPFSFARL